MSDDRFDGDEYAERERFRRGLAEENVKDPAPPLDASKHAAYITAAVKPFERLARMWECERIQCGRSLNAETPEDIGKQRFKDFWKTWDKTEGVT